MAIRNILLHAFEGEAGNTVRDVAFALAQKHDSHVSALSIVDNTPIPAYVVPYVPVNLSDTYIEEARKTAENVEAQTRAEAEKQGVRLDWNYEEGDLCGHMNVHARYADICVVGQGTGSDVPVGPANLLPDELILGSGRPVFIVPYGYKADGLGKKVLVAWNGSAQATRAVHDAMPLLQNADNVRILSVGGPENHLPGAEISAHLAQHDVNAEAHHAVEDGLSTAETISENASDWGADLVVCGAWGHSRLRETVLGGVTRHLLRNMTVPVVMSH